MVNWFWIGIARPFKEESILFSTVVPGKPDTHTQKNTVGSLSYTIYKNKMDQKQTRAKIIKLLEKKNRAKSSQHDLPVISWIC